MMFENWRRGGARFMWWLLVHVAHGVLIACTALMRFADACDELWYGEK